MMPLVTPVAVNPLPFRLEVGDAVVSLGSCFADEMATRMHEGGFRVESNPFGTLYNPASIAASLLRCISEREVGKEEVFCDEDGVWHSWMHHSSFSSSDVKTLTERINSTTHRVADFLREADVLIVTLAKLLV